MPYQSHHWAYAWMMQPLESLWDFVWDYLCIEFMPANTGQIEVSQFAMHGLSCKKGVRQHQHHSAVNDIIHRALVAAHVPSRLEPSGLYRSDGMWLEGASIVPWKCGQLLVWDETCPDTFAPSYSAIVAQQAGAVAEQAEVNKQRKSEISQLQC